MDIMKSDKKTNAANVRRVKRLRIHPEIIGYICSLNGTLKIESRLPPTARMVSLNYDEKEDCLVLFFECAEFELVKEGDCVDELPFDTVTFIDEGNDDV